jgi:hypothetical protein
MRAQGRDSVHRGWELDLLAGGAELLAQPGEEKQLDPHYQ